MRLVFPLFLAAPILLHAAEPVPNGVQLRVGNQKVELGVASPHAFRLSLGPLTPTTPAASPSSSIFLADPLPPAAFSRVDDGVKIGIKTRFGELLVDPRAKTWSLLSANGAVLTGGGSLGEVGTRPDGAVLHLTAGPTPNMTNPLFYGSGSDPKRGSLVQDHSDSRQTNGAASLPQYWSTAGYGLLALGPQGNRPASWHAGNKGAVDLFVPGDSVDLYLFPAANLDDWLRDDAEVTGFAPAPPIWSFGYMQSRWGWQDRHYIEDTLRHFRQDQLPVDVFIIDFEWYTKFPDYGVPPQGQDNFVDFTWNPALFDDPAKQIATYLQLGVHTIGIRKPRLGNTANLQMARAAGWIVPPSGKMDNIATRNLDYARPQVRNYWQENNRKFIDAGMAAFWNDEGELAYTEYSYWNLAEKTLLAQEKPAARFFSINRSFSPGLQRFGAAVWTGDIESDWATLARTPGELLAMGLSGIPYSACDIGGYGGADTSPELFTRWMEAGVFFPVMRSHSSHDSKPHFPWLYGAESEAAVRRALDLRYRLIPYDDSLAHETEKTGVPLMRPLVLEFPTDPDVANKTDEWLMGRGLLAAPILNPGGARSVYLPSDTWYEFQGNQPMKGPVTLQVSKALDEIPVYVRAGTLLPLGPVEQSTSLPVRAPLELQIYPGRDGSFKFEEDDGETTAYRQGARREVQFTWDDQKKQLTWKSTGSYGGPQVFTALKSVLFDRRGRQEKTAGLDHDGTLQF